MGQAAEHSGRDVGLRPPAALGVEGGGRIRTVGAGVQGISVGDRVVAHEAPLPGGSGFWAEQVLVTAAHKTPVPSELEPAAAAALPVNGLTALQALETLGLTTGQRLLITNGGGSTGSLAIQLAAAAGVEATATASPSAEGRLRSLGAAEVIDYHVLAWPRRAHRPPPQDSDLTRVVAVLARAQQDAIWNRQRATRSHTREVRTAAWREARSEGRHRSGS
ncbi:alcohol dehydrogenase catalytic domain-containing protein [Streptomyces barringtoniae]|uniref:alcohol dehydrogenase catalytic domain-containing protein n=1 Tax=Streptomyces barringtoniae TaxID=2892029 RepID=UPI001E2BAB2C|nr:alcohol dehydrogenase catalytic domain-containing protein [Streptomyces barringtoniae]MCC5478279.1 hypothetical protein [Streptomyces barringtoniae]